MPATLAKLIELAQSHTMSLAEKGKQRLSFAYGNTKVENDRVTRESVRIAAESLAEHAKDDSSDKLNPTGTP